MDKDILWKTALATLQLDVSEAQFNTWFLGTKLTEFKEGFVQIACPNAYSKERLSKTHLSKIKKALEVASQQKLKIEIVVASQLKNQPVSSSGPLFTPPTPQKTPLEVSQSQHNLNKHYTFDNFVVGNSNRLAHAVALAIAQSPGNAPTNPFFLYSDVGLGKTHLVHAIGNYVLKKTPQAKVFYCSGENFTNELLESIQRKKPRTFREKFRKLDMLIVDDVQFIAGRDSTQEEFFNTFNTLHNEGRQIVLASDKPPHQIPRLEERLSSRFGGGMMSDIQTPDVDVRTAILRSKRAELNYQVDNQTLDFIAQVVVSNIRELLGTLSQVVIAAQSQGQLPTPEIARQVLGKTYQIQLDQAVTPKNIIKQVCDYFEISKKEIKSSCRLKKLVLPRQIAMYLLRAETGLPLTDVGDLLGGRDHTTIMHGIKKIEALRQTEQKLDADIHKIRHNLSPKR